MIPIVISSMGVIPKSLLQSLTRLNLQLTTYVQQQKSVILGTCSNCKKLFKLQIRPPNLILLITTSQDRWLFPSQSWEVKNSIIIIIIIIIFVLRGLLQVHYIDEDWQTIICCEAFSDNFICTSHCFHRTVLPKQSSLSAYGCSARCGRWFSGNFTVPFIYVMISWFYFLLDCTVFPILCHSLKHASCSLGKV